MGMVQEVTLADRPPSQVVSGGAARGYPTQEATEAGEVLEEAIDVDTDSEISSNNLDSCYKDLSR